jgi:acyl-CoA synthetase (AMP-forming)/AMP-acid ligase II
MTANHVAFRPDPDLAAALNASTTVNEMIDRHAELRGGHIAVDMPSVGGGRVRLSFGELHDQILSIASGLLDAGVRAGDHIAILADGDSYLECVLGYLALLRIGAVMVPVNPRFVEEEVLYALQLADCVGMISQQRFKPLVQNICRTHRSLATLITIGSWDSPGWISWSSLLATHSHAEFADVQRDDPANIVFTSGTTGKPKGVLHTHATALATGAIYSRGLGLNQHDVFHHAIPFCTSSGTQFTLMAALWVGAALVAEGAFDARAILGRMSAGGTTIYLGVPSHLLFLLDEIKRQPTLELPCLGLWNYGGAAMPREAIEALRRGFPHTVQRQNYGMTETGPTGTILDPEYIDSRPGSTGRPMPLCEIRIVGDDEASLGPRQVGQILVRSPACMRGYYNNAEATVSTLVDGWVKTGDLGWLDDDGFLYYTDRLKDIINRGGMKIGSVEVEEILYRHADVLEAAVIAVPHPRLGEDIAAFVVARPDRQLSPADLQAFCAEHLAAFKVPRQIRIVQALPRNAMGKILKSELRKTASDEVSE